MTMQSLAVLLIGVGYGRTLGALTVLAYLAEGAAGIPVFASAAAGPAVLLGPTGGFLLGFVPAAYCAGWLAERGWLHGVWRAALGMLIGHIVLFVPGVLWLATFVGTTKALALGLTPFLPSTIVKVALGAAILGLFRGRLTAR
jgi:biotin transport system substrate-specific component